MLNYNEFHDGSFDGIKIDGDTAYIYLSSLKQGRFTVITHGIVALSGSGFKAKNLIFEVVTREYEEITPEDIAGLYDLAMGDTRERQAAQLLESAKKNKLILVEISPSYGAACAVLARSVELVRRD